MKWLYSFTLCILCAMSYPTYAGLETGDYIDDLVITNPASSDSPGQGDDHIRLVKKAVTQSFPSISGAVTATHTELNLLDGVTATTAEFNILDGVTATFTEVNYNDITTLGTVQASKALTADGSGITTNAIFASPVFNTAVSGTAVLDEDAMGSDSATQLATQQSIKAYVDSNKTEDYILIEDRKVAGTAGGGATAGSWETRTLNTETEDAGGHASIASNEITLAAGTYRIRVVAPVYAVGGHNARIYNVTDAGVQAGVGGQDLYGTSGSSRSNYSKNDSVIAGRFTIAGAKAIRVEHRVQSTVATNGYGLAGGFGEEIYTQVELWKEN